MKHRLQLGNPNEKTMRKLSGLRLASGWWGVDPIYTGWWFQPI